MPFVIEQLFLAAGENINNYLNIIKIEPVCRNFFGDGTFIDTSSDPDKMKAELSQIYDSAGEDYERFLQYSRKLYENTTDIFLFEPFQELGYLFKKRNIPFHRVLFLDALRTIDRANRSFFKDKRIVQLFNRFATYNGSSPFLAPATLNVIPYVEFGLGAYYINGGMYKLIEAIQKLIQKLDITVHLNSKVEKIEIKNGIVKGLSFSGFYKEFDYIVCSSDVVETFNALINEYEYETEKLNRLEPSLSGMLFLWGVKSQTGNRSIQRI